MCRLAAFPPGFPREEALAILASFEGGNTDGTGSAYVKDGKFVINKTAKPFHKILKKNTFLQHMPYDGWTIAHLRAASHGHPCKENTHPFVIGPWAFMHNGVWGDHNLVRLALSRYINFVGQTDSEVAGNLWNLVGPKEFCQAITWSGVFVGLNLDGSLWVVRSSGDLHIKSLSEDRILLASELNSKNYDKVVEGFRGWYHFDSHGKYLKHKEKSYGHQADAPFKLPEKGQPVILGEEIKKSIFPNNYSQYMGSAFRNESSFREMGEYEHFSE